MTANKSVIWWESLCGRKTPYDAFWSDDLTWNTDHPDFTDCFQNTALTWIPTFLILMGSLLYLLSLRSQRQYPYRGFNGVGHMQQVGLGLLIIQELFAIAIFSENGTPASLLATISRLISYVTAIWFTAKCCKYGAHNTGIMFFFWMFSFVSAGITFRSLYMRGLLNDYTDQTAMVFLLKFCIISIEFISSFFADGISLDRPLDYDDKTTKQEKDKKAELTRYHPMISCSFPCMLFRMWVLKYVWKGYQTKVQWTDLWKLLPECSSENMVPDFQRHWKRQMSIEEKQKKRSKAHFNFDDTESSGGDSSDSGIIEDITHKTKAEESKPEKLEKKDESKKKEEEKEDDLKNGNGIMLGSALIKSLGLRFALGSVIFYSLQCLMEFCQPFFVKALISFVEANDPHMWKGYLLAFGIFANLVCFNLFRVFHDCHNLSFHRRIKTVLASAIYRKSLTLSARANTNRTVGEIVNLMSTDAEKVGHFCHILFWFWSTPFVFGAALYLLYDIIGYSCLVGVLFLLLVLPLSSIILARKITSKEKKISDLKDDRIKLTNQVLSGIKVLKLYGWEPHFESKVEDIRKSEHEHKGRLFICHRLCQLLWESTPFLVASLCFGIYLYSNPTKTLNAQLIFVSIELLQIIKTPIIILPHVINYGSLCYVSLKRVSTFLQLEDIDDASSGSSDRGDSCITVKGGRFTWGTKKRNHLSNINIDIKKGELVGVVGEVGSGKSSLTSAILGEMIKLDGSVNVVGSRAYVPQQAWIQNMTLRKNVLFDKDYKEDQYKATIGACALERDLEILPGGDTTEIGEKGVNLSGGQKQRVSLARAVYQDADVYIMDDPLSAVDAHVGKHIFKNVIGNEGSLQNKTRILVTNQIQYLPHMDHIIVMDDCEISEQGTYEQLLNKNGRFADFIKTHSSDKSKNDDSTTSDDSDFEDCDKGNKKVEESNGKGHKKKLEQGKTSAEKDDSVEKPKESDEDEDEEVGTMSFSTMKWFISTFSWRYKLPIIVCVILCPIIEASSNVWLSLWVDSDHSENINTENYYTENTNTGNIDSQTCLSKSGLTDGLKCGNVNSSMMCSEETSEYQERSFDALFVIGIYMMLGLSHAICCSVAKGLIQVVSFISNNVVHNRLLDTMVKAPMSFYDTTPLGKIISRFSKDLETMTFVLPWQLDEFALTSMSLCITIMLITYNLPTFMISVLPLFLIFVAIRKFATPCTRQLEHINSNRRAPILSFFSETLNGTSSIRAYGCQDRFIRHNDRLLDDHFAAEFACVNVRRWMGMNGHNLANLSVLCCALFVIVYRDVLSPSIVGLLITYSFRISGEMVHLLHSSVNLETAAVSVEKVKEYTEKKTEAEWVSEDSTLALKWPQRGKIQFNNYSTKYRPELDFVVKQLNITILPSEKVGIVGRTGAGKSSLTLALFRIIEAVEGNITIDDVDIAAIGLHELRCKIGIIPQDPVLFSGSLRFNLDPANQYSDTEVWDALKHSHLEEFVKNLPGELDYECGEDGKNFSIGQRQLMCLARALLRKARILVLDEATASVDMDTDALIQETIRSEFKECTIITIAHRLNTIMDYDKIALLDAGKLMEFDSPQNLLKDSNSAFYSMAKDANLV